MDRFIEIIAKLRSPEGCPWDKEQTHASLKPYLIEEAHEVLEAIDENDPQHLREELGDLLLQVLLHAQIADDAQQFNIEDVAKDIGEKMVRRHPHVFGNEIANDSEQVLKNWDEIKKHEKAQRGENEKSILGAIPRGLPALFENYKISKKVAKVGFDWKKPSDIFAKISEEVAEVKTALRKKNKDQVEEELGDLLFTVANLCRAYQVNPEIALLRANKKFKKRFQKIEKTSQLQKQKLTDLSFKQWNEYWETAKK